MSFENERYVSGRIDRIEALEQEIARLKKQLESIKSPHNTIISSSEYAELLALNAELSDATRKNHEFVLYVSELKQQLEEAVEVIEFYLSKDLSDCIFKSDEDRHRQFLAKYRGEK